MKSPLGEEDLGNMCDSVEMAKFAFRVFMR
jgi:hypothetical protein